MCAPRFGFSRFCGTNSRKGAAILTLANSIARLTALRPSCVRPCAQLGTRPPGGPHCRAFCKRRFGLAFSRARPVDLASVG